jgi:hypothetical protein
MFKPTNQPPTHSLNRYQYEVSGSIELLTAYVADIERQIAMGIADYEANTGQIGTDWA